MAGPNRARGHVVHASLQDGSLVACNDVVTLLLSSGTRELVILQNRGSGSIYLTGSTLSTAQGLMLSTGAVMMFESVVPNTKLYGRLVSTGSPTSVMVQVAI